MASAAVQVQQFSNTERLHEWVTFDAAKAAKSAGRWEIFWNVVEKITLVAFVAIGTAAMVLTTVYTPEQLPFAALLTYLIALPESNQILVWMRGKQEQNGYERRLAEKILDRQNTLDLPKVKKKLKELHIKQGITKSKLTPLVARYLAFEKIAKESAKYVTSSLSGKVKLLIDGDTIEIDPKRYQVNQVDYGNDRERKIFQALTQWRANLIEVMEEAAYTKIQAAYALHLMENPRNLRPLSHFVERIRTPIHHRALATRFQDMTADAVARSKNRSWTTSEIFQADPAVLKSTMFQGD